MGLHIPWDWAIIGGRGCHILTNSGWRQAGAILYLLVVLSPTIPWCLSLTNTIFTMFTHQSASPTSDWGDYSCPNHSCFHPYLQTVCRMTVDVFHILWRRWCPYLFAVNFRWFFSQLRYGVLCLKCQREPSVTWSKVRVYLGANVRYLALSASCVMMTKSLSLRGHVASAMTFFILADS